MRVAILISIMNSAENLIFRGVPMTSTVVEFDDRTLAIIDTGLTDNPDLIDQLDDLGCKPSDFKFVFNTHLHPDHMGGNRLFSNARIFVSRKEYTYQQSRAESERTTSQAGVRPKNVVIREMYKIKERYPVAGLIGDPGQIEYLEDHPRLPGDIKLISAPGHSIDDRAVFLPGRSQNVLATGDALYHRDLWKGPSIPGINLNEDLFRANAQSLSEFQGIIIPGHDRAFRTASGEYLETNTFIEI